MSISNGAISAGASGFVAANGGRSRRAGREAVEALITGLKSEDAQVRTDAWLGAGKAGAAAVPSVVELMHDEDMEVARAAKRALEKIAREAGSPGSRRERFAVSRRLVEALERIKDTTVKQDVLWTLSEVAGLRAVEPVAGLLGSEDCREDARMVIERIGGPRAKAALRKAYREADDDFKGNLAQSMRALGMKVRGPKCSKLTPVKKTEVRPVQ